MSDSDSFIDEVNDEVRRDSLYRSLRKYGWIGILAVVIIVSGAAWNEYRKASAVASARALGETLLGALEQPTPDERVAAFKTVSAEGDMQGVVALLAAAEQLADEDPVAAVETLTPLAQSTDAPAVYSDLAAFKMVMIGGESVTPDLRSQLLERLARPGAPYRALAMEQQVLDLAATGETDAAIEAARALLQEPSLTPGLLRRISQLMVALGANAGENAG